MFKMLHFMKVNRFLKTLKPSHFKHLEIVPVTLDGSYSYISTCNVFYNSKNKVNSSSDINKANNVRRNVLIEKGLNEEKKSKAMQAYLERAQKHNAFVKEKTEEFNTGKRHLANMMGVDPETFSQEDIDAAIEYLFPSGLFVPGARPLMKPPEKIFPPKKDAEFDDSGRPFHFLFYTGKPNFFQLLHDFNVHLQNLNDYEDKMIRRQLQPDPNVKLQLTGSLWVTKEDLEKTLVEKLSDKEYNNFLSLMERIILHPYVYNIKDAVMSLRKPVMSVKIDVSKPLELSYDKDGRAYVTTTECRRKQAHATVTVWYPGTGKINVNGEDINYFAHVQPREQILFPLHFSGMLDKVDIDATVTGGGTSGQAGAIRWGIAWGLRSFVSTDMIEKMRLAGLLTRDVRRRERKKPGQWRARRKYTWKKR